MNQIELLFALNEASLILANRRASLQNGFALKGSILDRAREILEHAQAYVSAQAIEVGENL
jgi:hypothetical protein